MLDPDFLDQNILILETGDLATLIARMYAALRAVLSIPLLLVE